MYTKIKAIAVTVALLLFAVFAQTSYAALAAVGPADRPVPPGHGFPLWYQDFTGLSLGMCFDNNGFCISTVGEAPNPAAPIVFPDNFPPEGFYFIATTTAGPLGYEAALEFAFLPDVIADGNQEVFTRIRMRADLQTPGTYTVTHPYGVDTFDVAIVVAGREINSTVDIGSGIFSDALNGNVGPFLQNTAGFVTDPASGNVYLANPAAPVTVTGSEFGTNFVLFEGPDAGLPVRADQFNLEGKVIGLTATPSSVVFPSQKPGVTTASAPITITNIDALNAAVLSAGTITGADAADFTLGPDTCSGATIPASGTCSVTVNFSEAAPGVNGVKSAIVSFPVTAPANRPPVVINVSGAIDNILPTVVSTIPADNAVNVPSNNAITATFNEVVTGVSAATFTLSGPGGAVTGTVSFDEASRTATFTPSANLIIDAAHTATITTGIVDLAGNALAQDFVWSFTTTLPDTTPPAVVSSTPAVSEAGVPTNQAISVVFNEPVLAATVNGTTFTLSSEAGAIVGAVAYDTQSRTATFTPSQLLAVDHAYTVTVNTGVQSLGGVTMAADFAWTFATTAAPTAPQLIAPAAGQTGIGTSVGFQWVKSADSDNDAITYHLFYCTNANFVGTEAGCTTPVTVAQSRSLGAALAGLGGYGVGLLLAGFAIVGGVKSRRKLFFLIAALLISGMAVTACSDNNGVAPAGSSDQPVITDPADPAQLVTMNVAGLTPGRVYYWKVVADDGKGARTGSETRTFTTQE